MTESQLHIEISRAEEQQRRVIAENLHDHVGQALALLKMKLRELQSNSAFCGFEGNIEDMRRLLDQTIAYTRSLTSELSPPLLYDLGLVPALEWLVDDLQKKSGKRIRFEAIDRHGASKNKLTDDQKIAIYRACHEYLMNAIKHSDAEFIELVFHDTSSFFEAHVRDNGKGHSRDAVMGFGLMRHRERLTAMGIHLAIQSDLGQGTRIDMRMEY